MKTKEAIKLLEKCNFVVYPMSGRNKSSKEIITLLKHLEKYKVMWKELTNSLEPEGNPDYSDDIGDYNAVFFMKNIEQKYFPKPKCPDDFTKKVMAKINNEGKR